MKHTITQLRLQFHRQRTHQLLVTVLLLILLGLLALASLLFGNQTYTLADVYQTLVQGTNNSAAFVLETLRLPRMSIGLLSGFAFGVAGITFQKLFHNPLASPDIIGVSAGASLGAVFAMLILQLSGLAVSLIAIASALTVSCLIFFLSGTRHENGKMVLIGIGMQALLQALISYFLLKASQYDVAGAMRWLSGSLNQVNMQQFHPLALGVGIGTILLALLARQLQVVELGESFAMTLGVNVRFVKLAMMVIALLLCAFAAALTGPIASVSFLSGILASKLSKGGNNLIQAGLIGAILVLGANLIAQNLLPARYPVGVVTGMLGAPFLLLQLRLLHHRKERAS